jgi:hypothetical protein
MDKRTLATAAFLAVVGLTSSAQVQAQQATGESGSPRATTTLGGKQLPPPPPKFDGSIKQSAVDSKPWRPPRVVPPKGAPNVLLIIGELSTRFPGSGGPHPPCNY